MATQTKAISSSARRRWAVRGVLLLVLVVALALAVHRKLHRVADVPTFAGDDAAWFMYGAIGVPGVSVGSTDMAMPYWIWFVLPRVFPDFVPGPGGYASFGFVWEPGQELPAGFAKSVVGFPRVTNNCALCHTAKYRTQPDEMPSVVPGGPGSTANVQALLRFYRRCAEDSRFNADVLFQELDLVTKLSAIDRFIYRRLLIPRLRRELRSIPEGDAAAGVAWGPGRQVFVHPNAATATATVMPAGGVPGASDAPALWGLKARRDAGQGAGWGGEAASPATVVAASAVALGASGDGAAQRLTTFLDGLSAPAYPFAATIDRVSAASGREVFARVCGDCHAPGGKRTNTVIPIDDVGTDPERMRAGNAAGYLATTLDGLWLRAPYLHNGAVPTLRALLDLDERRRTVVFHRGYDVLDRDKVGFVAGGAEAERVGVPFDTRRPGNGNGGHRYGTDLAPADKNALIEFLKTQ
ncbi:MAG: cytochrome c [Bacteroidota bacterium]